MSPSAIPKTDPSVGWPQLACCPHRHPVSAACPPTDAWLVLGLCTACNPAKQLYCRTHRDRHMPQPGQLVLAGDARGLAAGETTEGD